MIIDMCDFMMFHDLRKHPNRNIWTVIKPKTEWELIEKSISRLMAQKLKTLIMGHFSSEIEI